MPISLRPWQASATEKAVRWLVDEAKDRHFLINAAPGAGKTLCAIAIAERLFARGVIDSVVVIAPRAEVVNQWSRDYNRALTKPMVKVVGANASDVGLGLDVCATWAAIEGLSAQFKALCASRRTLVICDEHHHAAVEAAWGESADTAFADAKYVLVLTGTPVRSDGAQSIWLRHGDQGEILHPAEGSYTLTYGEAVDLEYCRPVTFHRHEGRFTVDLDNGQSTEVSGTLGARLPEELQRIPALQGALEFYRLACQPQYDPESSQTPSLHGFHASMLEAAILKLDELRLRMPNAGGLVIAPSIEMAEFFKSLLTQIEGEAPIVVHTDTPGAEQRIAAFRNSHHKWLVSVAMVSEGVDIPRLRVMVYLPSARTELAFRQAVGRVVRNSSEEGDDTRAYVVMPRLQTFEAYARRIEEEIAHVHEKAGAPRYKRCPTCQRENEVGASVCDGCGHVFPKAPERTRPCPACTAPVRMGARRCGACGHDLQSGFVIRLREAMREGVIARGVAIDEGTTRLGEEIAEPLRRRILQSGDANLIRIIRLLPVESMGHLKLLLSQGDEEAPEVP
ncbi:MAG: hypothetical protein RL199_1982 [Pseudomonadota bacterium]|jgi:superfamily II DNA or RNA helicase